MGAFERDRVAGYVAMQVGVRESRVPEDPQLTPRAPFLVFQPEEGAAEDEVLEPRDSIGLGILPRKSPDRAESLDVDLQKAGEIVQQPTVMPWGNVSMLLRDPDGAIINIFSRPR